MLKRITIGGISMAYSGTIWRGVDYSPTWPNWSQGAGNSQTNDSDFANDAFASFWAASYQTPPTYSNSVPIKNGSNYRDDIGTISSEGFNVVRLYDWDMSRGTSVPNPVSPSTPTAQDHYNFLNYANSKGVKVVVPVSDYFISNQQYAWGTTSPDSTYSFGSAPASIQQDFINFIASITDPKTKQIHQAIHSISIGNEPDIGQGVQEYGTDTSQFLARTIWWIHNLNLQINGQTGTGPDGYAVVANPTKVMFSATYSDGDQGAGGNLGWFYDLVNGVTKDQKTPNGAYQTNFPAAVVGLKTVDPNYTDHYYNSVNISQIQTAPPYDTSGLTGALSSYDTYQTGQWPFMQFEVPLMLMEVFTPNRQAYTPQTEQVNAAVAQVTAIENYLKTNAGTTWLMGHNYFEFNDEASQAKWTGLYQYTDASSQVNTGTTSTFFGGFPSMSFPSFTLTPTMNTDKTSSLVDLWTSKFGATEMAASIYDVRASMNNTTIFNLYGTLDRQPDINGYKYWVDANQIGMSLQDISKKFIASFEFTSKYGADISDQQFINKTYLNILDRPADAGGLDWWQTQIAQYSDYNSGRAAALLGIVGSPEAIFVMNNNISNHGYFLS